MTSLSSRVRRSQTFLLALLASSAVFTAGCANMATTAVGGSGDAVTLGGTIHGGNEPVSGATVTLWFAGQGNSSPAVLAATTASANDGAGSFSFAAGSSNGGTSGNTYTCPANNPYVYVIANGGNTQGPGTGTHNNAAAYFLAPYGPCSTLSASSFVDMTEVTTVATMAALQQYFVYSATAPVLGQAFNTGGSGLSYQSMGYAFNLVSNMVNLANGAAISPVTGKTINGSSTGQGTSGTSLVATPESAKINTIANILAACINIPDYPAGGNTACDTLFANAAPPVASTTAQPGANYTAATNTLQAVYYMLSNPTNGSTTALGSLYALSAAAGAPFQPTLSAVPSDWTIAISYASTSTCGASNGHLIHSVQDIAVDANGDIWLANNESGGNLTVLQTNNSSTSPNTIVPAGCLQIGSGKNTGITIDALISGTSGLANIWLADSGSSNVYRYHPPNAATTAVAFPTSAAPASIAADGVGNVYYTVPSSATLFDIPLAATATPPTLPATAGVSIATAIGSAPSRVLVDSAPSVWTTSGTTSINRTACTAPTTVTPGCTTSSFTTSGSTYGIAATAIYIIPGGTRNSIFVSMDGSSLTLYQGINTTYTQITGWPLTTLSTPLAVASDGAQNVWTVNNLSNANSVFEAGVGKQALSPAAGFQKTATYLGGARSLAIDSSGNVWIGLDGANSVTEIVGAAVPVVQPFAAALNKGTFQTIP